jgi:hypothetical protein
MRHFDIMNPLATIKRALALTTVVTAIQQLDDDVLEGMAGKIRAAVDQGPRDVRAIVPLADLEGATRDELILALTRAMTMIDDLKEVVENLTKDTKSS